MDIKVGAYKLNGEFKNRKQAREIFLTHYPLVTESRLDTELDKLFKNADKSDDLIPAIEKSSESDAKDGARGVGKKQLRGD